MGGFLIQINDPSNTKVRREVRRAHICLVTISCVIVG
jgi:hypothetical protein